MFFSGGGYSEEETCSFRLPIELLKGHKLINWELQGIRSANYTTILDVTMNSLVLWIILIWPSWRNLKLIEKFARKIEKDHIS